MPGLLNTNINLIIRKYKKNIKRSHTKYYIRFIVKATTNISCIATLTSTVARSAVNTINSC